MKGLLDGAENLSKIFAPSKPPRRKFKIMNDLNEMSGFGDMSGFGGLGGFGGKNGINGFFEMLFTGADKPKPPPKNEDFLSKLLLADKKQPLQLTPSLITERK